MSLNVGDLIPFGNDTTLISHLSWAGGSFPFAGTEDLVISANTTWSDMVGYRKVKKLTINAGVTLRIIRSPFYIFADEIVFGNTSSSINASGFNGNENPTGSDFAQGGGDYTKSRGGDGGGILVVCARKISGPAGKIMANGGNAHIGGSVAGNQGGQGAFSVSPPPFGTNYTPGSPQNFVAGKSSAFLHPLGFLLAKGGGADVTDTSAGGGNGGSSYSSHHMSGGSGIGGGGGVQGSPIVGGAAFALTPLQILQLALFRCLGGGGGAIRGWYNSTLENPACGGGGGGAVLVFYSEGIAPVVTANGGTGANGGGSGGAGVTHVIKI